MGQHDVFGLRSRLCKLALQIAHERLNVGRPWVVCRLGMWSRRGGIVFAIGCRRLDRGRKRIEFGTKRILSGHAKPSADDETRFRASTPQLTRCVDAGQFAPRIDVLSNRFIRSYQRNRRPFALMPIKVSVSPIMLIT
jgi:hypothetical protein